MEFWPLCKHGIILALILPQDRNQHEKNFLESPKTLVKWGTIFGRELLSFIVSSFLLTD
jgi:hypothetical protein